VTEEAVWVDGGEMIAGTIKIPTTRTLSNEETFFVMINEDVSEGGV
jgi:hypothetical protein